MCSSDLGVQAAVITGTLGQWRDAVRSGTKQTAEPTVRACYCKILVLFEQAGLGHVWADCEKRPAPDQLFYLEDKRNR